MVSEMGKSQSKENRNNILSQLQEVLDKVQSARRHLPFLSVPDVYLCRAEGMLQEVLKSIENMGKVI